MLPNRKSPVQQRCALRGAQYCTTGTTPISNPLARRHCARTRTAGRTNVNDGVRLACSAHSWHGMVQQL